MNEISSAAESCDTPLLPKNIKLKNTIGLFLGHFNVNSVVGKFDHLKVLIGNNIDILIKQKQKLFLVSVMLNLELMDFQHLLDLTEIDLVVDVLFMFERT